MPPRRKSNFGDTQRHILIRERTAKALKMRRAGYTPSQIARRLPEYNTEKQVRVDLRKALQEMIQEPAQELLALQYHRFEMLILSIWREALAGDYQAHDRILKLIEGENRLLRLGQGTIGEDNHSDVERWLAGLIGQVAESTSDDIEDDAYEE